jgi:hypothetical protein
MAKVTKANGAHPALHIVKFSYRGEDAMFGSMEGEFSVLISCDEGEEAIDKAGEYVIEAVEAGRFLGDLSEIRLYIEVIVQVSSVKEPVIIDCIEHPFHESWDIGLEVVDAPRSRDLGLRFGSFVNDDSKSDPSCPPDLYWESDPGHKPPGDESKQQAKLHVRRAFLEARAESRSLRRANRVTRKEARR